MAYKKKIEKGKLEIIRAICDKCKEDLQIVSYDYSKGNYKYMCITGKCIEKHKKINLQNKYPRIIIKDSDNNEVGSFNF